MKTKLTKEQIEKLNGIQAEERSSLIQLFEEVNELDGEIQKLRKSQPRESQLVVERTKWDEMEAAVKTRDGKISELEQRLAALPNPLSIEEFGALQPVFDLFS